MHFAILFLILAAVFQPKMSSAQQSEKILRIGIGQEFDSLNPMSTAMLSALYIYNMVGRNFVSLDHEMKWQPQLVVQIPSFKNKLAEIKKINGVEKLVSNWSIKTDAKWGDGVDITCQDVLFSWTVGQSAVTTVINREAYTEIESINCNAKKPKQVEFVHSSIRWDFYKLYQFYLLPKHLEEPIFSKYGNEKQGFDHRSNYVKNPTLPGLYNGPYLISEIKLGSHVIVKRNPFFYGKKPYFDKIQLRLISDTTALETNLVSKQIDMISTIGLNMNQALNFEKKIVKDSLPLTVRYIAGLSYEHMELNLDNPILKSKNVRLALLKGIDRSSMVKALFDDKQAVARHFLSPRDPWFTRLPKSLQQPTVYSKKEAEKLLESDGWKLSGDGYRYKDGKKLSLVFSTTAGDRLRESVQVYIIDQWKKIGIETSIKNSIARTFFADQMGHRKFESVGMFTWTFLPETPPTKFYGSKHIPSDANGWAGRNYSGYKNEKLDQLLERLEVELSESKRQSLMNQIIQIYTDDRFTLPLYNRVDISVTPKDMKGYNPTGTQQMETLFVENWSL